MPCPRHISPSSNGRTRDFGSRYGGSSPSGEAINLPLVQSVAHQILVLGTLVRVQQGKPEASSLGSLGMSVKPIMNVSVAACVLRHADMG